MVYTDQTKTANPVETQVVCDFIDVFRDALLRLPPKREIDFIIYLIHGSEPASKALYRMAPAELK